MSASDFLPRFLGFADADTVKFAAHCVTKANYANRREAEADLRAALAGPNAAKSAWEMLEALHHEVLKDWAYEFGSPKPRNKEDAKLQLVAVYFDLEAEDDDDEDDSDDEDTDDDNDDDGYAPPTLEERRAMLRPRPSPHVLRDYQNDAVETAWRHRQLKTPRFQVSIPTGGGKTAVGMAVVARELRQGGRVLWVTMNWPLLWQAAETAGKDHDLYRRNELGRYGGNGKSIDVLTEAHGNLRFTTTHTLVSRIQPVLRSFKPTLVVWDECHWGQAGKLARPLKKALERLAVPILGLSATPKAADAWGFDKVYGITFGTLVDRGYLARAVVEQPVPTRGRAQPKVHLGEFSRSYLTELADDDARNADIVAHYERNRSRYGKTILFAVDIAHANELERLFLARDIDALAVHSGFDETENGTTMERFKRGTLDVLIGVAMVTHGLDIPDIRTVMIARPTMSDILYAQMVGRGARIDKASGKTTFRVVDFVDASNVHHEGLVLGKPYFDGAGGARPEGSDERTGTKGASTIHTTPEPVPTDVSLGAPSGLQGSVLNRLNTAAHEAVRKGDAEGRVALDAAKTALSKLPETSFTLAACDNALRDLSVFVSTQLESAARDARTVPQRQLQRQLDVLLELRRAFMNSETLALWLAPPSVDKGIHLPVEVGSATTTPVVVAEPTPPAPLVDDVRMLDQPTTPQDDAPTTTLTTSQPGIDLTKAPLPSPPPAPPPAPTCSTCAAALDAGQNFCHDCGTKVVRPPTSCPRCQARWREGAKFCGACGAAAPT